MVKLSGNGLRNRAGVVGGGERRRLGCGHRVQALRERCRRGRSARVVAKRTQTYVQRGEQLADARRADRPLKGAAEAHILGGRELQVELVRIDAAGHRVVRVAESGTDEEVLDEGLVLDHREAQLDEPLAHPEAGVDGLRGGAGTRQLPALKGVIRPVGQVLVAMLEADIEADAFIG